MRPHCPHCNAKPLSSADRTTIVRDGSFRRKSDSRRVRKFICRPCGKHFSFATLADEYRQKKRRKNERVRKLFVERCSLRGIARIERLSRRTVARKLEFLGLRAEIELKEMNERRRPIVRLQFDDQETAEQSKYKPLAISLGVCADTRWIVGFEISQMPVKWKLSPAKRRKYGLRRDDRVRGRARLFKRIRGFLAANVEISSDQHPHYPRSIRQHLPGATHKQYESRKPIDHGQDELKRGWDPLFNLNHTCAMHRDRVSRLARKSWCLSKSRVALARHLAIYAVHHNKTLSVYKNAAEKEKRLRRRKGSTAFGRRRFNLKQERA